VWAFAHVLPGAIIGRDCNICDGVFVENDVVVGDRVTVKCGVQLWDGVRLEDGRIHRAQCDLHQRPLSAQPPASARAGEDDGAEFASIGANATILPEPPSAMGAMIGAGAVVTSSVPPYAIVVGNPARIVGYASGDSGGIPKRGFPPGPKARIRSK
jgi:acetyltransferase-like isoleucine patch superfamily enzyme